MIVTSRARWILLLATSTALLSLFQQQDFLLCLSLASLAWIFFEWLCFRYRVDLFFPAVRAERTIRDSRGPSKVLWVGRSVDIHLKIIVPRRYLVPPVYTDLRDLIPPARPYVDGTPGGRFLLGDQETVSFDYRLKPIALGSLRFSGLRLVLTDLHGFFLAERFISVTSTLRVLPMPTAAGTASSIRKQRNLLPPPGIHSLARSGVGSELLEIRDYLPGDSPRSIAWKVSARRDNLMSKQFEHEVPIRCQILCDVSRSMRLGYPGPCQLQRLMNLAAAVMQTLIAHRDPVGMSLFDGTSVQITRPTANRKTALRMLDQMAAAIDTPLPPVDATAEAFLPAAFDLARMCYPLQLVRSAGYAGRLAVLSRWRRGRLRLQLASIVAAHYRLGPMALGQLSQDDHALSRALQTFLAEYRIPYVGPLTDRSGKYLFEDRAKIEQLAKLLTVAVRRARDNELYVIMAGLLDTEYDLAPLIRAIKMAKARHHRVAVLCAWPTATPTELENREHVLDQLDRIPAGKIAALAERQVNNTRFHALRTELGRLRVPVVAATDEIAGQLILSQLELIRMGRTLA